MSRRIFQVGVLVCLASVAFSYPAIESLDRWDGPGPDSDSEIYIIALFTVLGISFVVGDLLARLAATLDRVVVAPIRAGVSTRMTSTPEIPFSKELIASSRLALRI